MLPEFPLYCTDPAQHLVAAGYDLDALDRDLSAVCTFHSIHTKKKLCVRPETW